MTRSAKFGAGLIALLAPAILAAQSLPFHQKSGLWLIAMTMQGTPHASKQCVSDGSRAFEEQMSAQVRKRDNCTPNQVVHNPDGSWSDSYTCSFAGGRRTTAHSTFRGDFNTKFTATFDTGTSVNTSTFTYAGPCPAGMRGGDVEMDGKVYNMMAMMKNHP
jgi:hypothetical protein